MKINKCLEIQVPRIPYWINMKETARILKIEMIVTKI